MRRVRRIADATRVALAAAAAAMLCAAPRAFAQSSDVPPPPRLDRAPEVFTITPKDLEDAAPDPSKLTASQLVTAAAPARPPNAARLAPLPEGRSEPIEEIVVLGGNWRLPDLGSRWREKQRAAEEDAKGRAHLTFVPLYDPERPAPTLNSLYIAPELARMGYIELFRVRFGRHPKSESEP
ncbi:MAG TPA: hypothetical protein VMU03_01980 [Gammaproteobacteria bacterium]|jgi:hypothetical protein|nr:hypothetical protein [Gammaproteobacteria bacterium]